jgi:hypothetical protein
MKQQPLVILCVLALLAALPAGAATSSLAYDSVSKFLTNKPDLEPGDFDADYATAAAVPAPTKAPGGMFGKLVQNRLAQAMGSMAEMSNGLAERVAIAGTRERTDYPSLQKADILDCTARTITELDLKNKTYTVESIDAPPPIASTASRNNAPNAIATDDGTRVAVTVVNKALGAKQVGGVATDGYTSDVTLVMTKANGDATTNTMHIKEYISKTADVQPACSPNGHGTNATAMGSSMLTNYTDMMHKAATAKDSHFTYSSSGPAFPSTLLSMFEAVTFTSNGGQRGGNGQITILTERANIHTVSPTDPLFSVPPDFTKKN